MRRHGEGIITRMDPSGNPISSGIATSDRLW